MALLSITAASVLAGANALTGDGIAGATITQGQPLYKDAADSNKLKPADANGSAATASVVGFAQNAASSGQPVKYVYSDAAFVPGATLVVGEPYFLASTAGSVGQYADLAIGDRPVLLFVAVSTTVARLAIVNGTAARLA